METPNSIELTLNLDRGTVGFGVDDVLQQVQSAVIQLSPDAQGALAWLPASGDASVDLQVDLHTGAVAAAVTVSNTADVRLATAFVLFTPGADNGQAAVSVGLDQPLNLGGTPLFGTLLSGVQIADLSASYSTIPLSAGVVHMPDGSAAPPGDIGQGFGLSLTVTAGGASQTLRLTSQPSDATPNDASNVFTMRHAAMRDTATAADGAPTLWFPVQKSFGPLSLNRIGVVLGAGTVGLALDSGLTTDVVDITLTGFAVRLSKSPTSVSVTLDGLAVSVSNGPLQIAGSLTRSTAASAVEYDGSLVIRVGQYAINAAGSYGEIAGSPSLFVFGLAQGAFGGPPMFFVTGLAAGFGVNRALRLPPPEQVRTFPLIEAATAGPGYLPAGGVEGTQDALAKLATGGWVPPTAGEYWVAAGVAFRSFELINGFALVSVQFGRDLSIALLGVAAVKLPTETDGGPVFAYAEIELEAVLVPAAGTFSLTVLLSSNSYVIAPECRLTGGLAVYFWFGPNPHAGDFVVSLGGYHPLFVKPDWYPKVPRLGFRWQLSDAIQISGDSYFAVTPACAMAGGRLSLTFDAGPLQAWFLAQADFIMFWRPFWFEIEVLVSIGVSYTASLALFSATFTVSLGVSVQLWGPPLRGVAHVSWFVISFDIPINGGGSPTSGPTTLADWSTFAAASLSSATAAADADMSRPAAAATTPAAVCRARPAGALRGMVDLGDATTIWLLGGDGIAVHAETAVPASTISIGGPTPQTTVTMVGETVHVYPLGNVAVTSALQIVVTAWTGTPWQPGQPVPTAIDVSAWTWNLENQNVPAALWAARGDATQAPLSSNVVPGTVGVAGVAPAPTLSGGLELAATTLAIDELPPRGLPLGSDPIGDHSPATTGDTRAIIASSIIDPTVRNTRSAIINAIVSCGLAANVIAGSLPLFSSEIMAVLSSAPMIGALGSTGPPSSTSADRLATHRAPAAVAPMVDMSPDRSRPVLVAVIRHDEPTGTSASTRPRAEAAPRVQHNPPPSAYVLDRYCTRAERRFAATHRAQLDRDPHTAARLWPGWTAVWDVPEPHDSFSIGGANDLWMVALDPGQQVLMFQPLTAGAEHLLPPTTRRVALRHLPAQEQATLGWTGASTLHQIASQTFLSGAVLIRSQSPLPAAGRQSRRAVGGGTARQVLDGNWTQDLEAHCHRGWLETWLPGHCANVSVTIAPDPGAHPLPTPPTVTQRLAPPVQLAASRRQSSTNQHGARTVTWRYPLRPQGPSPVIVVRAQPPVGWRVAAVTGLAGTPTPGRPRRPRPHAELEGRPVPRGGAPIEVRWG